MKRVVIGSLVAVGLFAGLVFVLGSIGDAIIFLFAYLILLAMVFPSSEISLATWEALMEPWGLLIAALMLLGLLAFSLLGSIGEAFISLYLLILCLYLLYISGTMGYLIIESLVLRFRRRKRIGLVAGAIAISTIAIFASQKLNILGLIEIFIPLPHPSVPIPRVEKLDILLPKAEEQIEEGELLKAIETLQEIQEEARRLNNKPLEAAILIRMAMNYNSIYLREEALDYLNQARVIVMQTHDRLLEAAILNEIAEVNHELGRPQIALDHYNLSLWTLAGAHARARTPFLKNSEYSLQKATEHYQQALGITVEVKFPWGEASILNNIGAVYYSIGQPQKALEYYRKARRKIPFFTDREADATILNNIGAVYHSIGQPEKALEYYRKALQIQTNLKDRDGEAATLTNMGATYDDIGQSQEALKSYEQALFIIQEVSDIGGKAAILNNIGEVYRNSGEFLKALEYYNEALPIAEQLSDLTKKAIILNNLGEAYYSIDRPAKALKYYNQALPILHEIRDRAMTATTLNNIGLVYRDTNQPNKAIENLQQSVQIILEMRAGLQQQNRKPFIQDNEGTPIALVDLLIDQNQPDEAFKWYNLATTFDLADYTRLIDAKVKNPEAQKLIDQWQQNHQRLQYLYARVEDQWTPQLSQQLNQLTAETNQLAEAAKNRYPEVAELFETTPQDIDKLKANIPPGTLVIQPALLTGVKDVPDSIAIFLVSRDQATLVKKVAIDAQEFDRLLTEYRAQLQNPTRTDYDLNQELLYDHLIRPVEAEIAAASPKQLAIIATGKLRYIPFETLYDAETDRYLLEKYPIHYLTRIWANRPTPNETTAPTPRQILAFGNPTPTLKELQGAEDEAKTIVKILPGEPFIRERATLARFTEKSPGFTLLHLATHGCFQKGGCPNLDMEANTILFANGETFNIADAARLGLENTDLIALSACQTAMKADSNGEEIAGVAYLFERAGAGAVMASLWNAEDEATKKIMVEFYQNVKGGMSKVDALRQAKLSQVDSHPFNWSPLILIGDGSSL